MTPAVAVDWGWIAELAAWWTVAILVAAVAMHEWVLWQRRRDAVARMRRRREDMIASDRDLLAEALRAAPPRNARRHS